MTLLKRIQDVLEFEDVVVTENVTYSPIGTEMRNFSVNKRGVVLQFSIPKDETSEGVLEDFLEYIEATVQNT